MFDLVVGLNRLFRVDWIWCVFVVLIMVVFVVLFETCFKRYLIALLVFIYWYCCVGIAWVNVNELDDDNSVVDIDVVYLWVLFVLGYLLMLVIVVFCLVKVALLCEWVLVFLEFMIYIVFGWFGCVLVLGMAIVVFILFCFCFAFGFAFGLTWLTFDLFLVGVCLLIV